MACFPSRFSRMRWISEGLSKGRLVASLRYTLNYLHSSQQIFSLRSNMSEENVTFKWLTCTSQESRLRFERARRKETEQKKDTVRERGEERAREENKARERETAHDSFSRKSPYSFYSANWENLMVRQVLKFWCQLAWDIPRTRRFGLARAYESYYSLQKHRGHYILLALKLALLVIKRLLLKSVPLRGKTQRR